MKKGKLIVLYGINNLGKTTQAKLLVDSLQSEGHRAQHIKYAIYHLEPTGPIINDYLRAGNPHNLTPREVQIIQAYNRAQYEPKLIQDINNGDVVIAEDYWGTGIAWGMGKDVEQEFLLKLNQPFQHEDLAILLDGERFTSGKEKGHLHESDDELTSKVRRAHLDLAKQFSWKIVNANQKIENVHQDIMNLVKTIL